MDTTSAQRNIKAQFYKQFSSIRDRIVASIESNLQPREKYIITQRFFNRIFILYFLCSKQILRLENGRSLHAKELFDLLQSKGKLVTSIYRIFTLLQTKGTERQLSIGGKIIRMPFLHEAFYPEIAMEQQIENYLQFFEWQDIFDFFDSFNWQIERLTEHKTLTPEILGYIYERSSVEWENNTDEQHANFSSRKNKGVFYTQEEITQYILNNTLYPIFLDRLENRYTDFLDFLENGQKEYTKAIEIIDSLTILDPACGSGAFIQAAAKELFRLKCCLLRKMGHAIINFELKKQLIENNLFGVDLLDEPLEITKIWLWLWVLEIRSKYAKEQVLPKMVHFQKGNSLIGNISKTNNISIEKEMRELEPMNWNTSFSDEISKGGFDIIIGNPPYGAKISEKEQKLINKTYLYTTSKNTAEYFIERSHQLLKPNGYLGFVVPKQIAFTHKWRYIREYLLQRVAIKNLFDVGLAFEGVDYEALVIITKKIITVESLENEKVRIDIATNTRSTIGSKKAKHLGYNKQRLMQFHLKLIFKYLTPLDEEIIQTIKDNSEQFGFYFKEPSFRGIYFNQTEEKQLQNGDIQYIRGGPSIQRHYLKNGKFIRLPINREKEALKILKPKIIFKALRGTQLVAFADIQGTILTDSNMNNIILKDNYSNLLKPLHLILNHKVVSFYLSKLVFSDTTETARHLDNPYVIPIPIPKEIDCSVASEIADLLFFLNQHYYTNFLSTKKSESELENLIAFFEGLASALSYELFFQEVFKSDLQGLLEKQFSTENKQWTSLKKIQQLYTKLLSEEGITKTTKTILSHEYVKRIEGK